jgi:hypothetical protein
MNVASGLWGAVATTLVVLSGTFAVIHRLGPRHESGVAEPEAAVHEAAVERSGARR